MSTLTRRGFGRLAAGAAVVPLAAPTILRAQEGDLVRMCWTNTVTVSAQAQHALLRTDIPARNGLRIQMTQMNGSPAINEALASNAADIGSVSDFSAVTMMAVGAPITTVALQSRFRSAILATTKSGIKTMADLKGKQVYGLFGITAFQNAQDAVRAAGLTPGRDVTFVNIGTAELTDAVRTQRIEAFFHWDPWVAFFEDAGHATVLSHNTTPAMVLSARSDFVQKKPDVLKRFLRAHSEAVFYASQNHKLTNGWFRSLDPAKGIPETVIETASAFDPVWNAKSFSEVRAALSPAEIANMQNLGQWGLELKLLPRLPQVAKSVNTEIAGAVDAEAASKPFDPASVKILS
ncbi:ABC transporter substrate-binding protein [Enterovirga rhinocerotis]|uniref:Sulfonate transport system substrate-binding protein n=1 Tax=Enterovirga rhinocerotis TaxID=1339210 RepID=A0A4R7C569_9HYPH|nr:NrtA/SsuA/CpmA family ABC transporter substrate-binding protein [Enterovirga rhinocerotis]TDR93528.1 sulfonate transport system substrate-binding protein [Enterovirga rhinocerotis]